MISRRVFLKSTGAGAAALCMINPLSVLTSCASVPEKLNFGFISGIIGKELRDQDWKTVLAKTVEFGFTEIETGRAPGNASTEEFLAFCKEIGLKLVAGGLSMNEDPDAIRKRLDELSALGVKYAVNYWPWLTEKPFMLEACKQSAPILNMTGEICREYGITFCWHNHDNEFFEMEEGTPFDYLMENTDSDLVKCELDVFWAAKGGADPLEYLKKYAGRYPILHLKDMTADDERTFECVGQGIIDFPAILAESKKQGIKHFMVEFDNVVDGMACLESSGKYLHSLSI